MSKDYYEILGVKKDATDEELKAAYRRLSLKLHPDRQSGKSDAEKKEAEEKFKEVNEAYATLKDKDKRASYDRFGADGPQGFGGGGGFDPYEFFRKMHEGRGNGGFGDFGFGDFGFGMGGARRDPPPDPDSPEDGRDVQVSVEVPFKESVFGSTHEFEIGLDRECPECHGTGAAEGSRPEVCPHCHGTGSVTRTERRGWMASIVTSPCPHCGGTGWTFNKCQKCGGKRRVPERKKAKFKIPAGISSGQRLRLKGMGRCGVCGGEDGDLYITVNVGPSELFRRDGDDIWTTVFVSPATAALGGSVDVATPYGWEKAKVEPGTVAGAVLWVKGAGMRTPRGKGDLKAKVVVETMSSLTPEQKDLLKRLRESETGDNFRLASAMRTLAEDFFS